MWELDNKEGRAPKNWCLTVVLEKTLESPLDSKVIQPAHYKGDQSWVFIGRTDAEAETPILSPPDVKSWLMLFTHDFSHESDSLEKILMLGGIGVSALASVLKMNTQDWFPLEWTGWISLQSKGLSRVFSNTIVQKHQLFSTQLSSQSNSHIHTWLAEKP